MFIDEYAAEVILTLTVFHQPPFDWSVLLPRELSITEVFDIQG